MTYRYCTMQVRVGGTTRHSAPRTPVSFQRHGTTSAHVPSVPDTACSSLPRFFTSALASFAYASPPRPSAFLLRSVVGITRNRSNPLWDGAPVRAKFSGNIQVQLQLPFRRCNVVGSRGVLWDLLPLQRLCWNGAFARPVPIPLAPFPRPSPAEDSSHVVHVSSNARVRVLLG